MIWILIFSLSFFLIYKMKKDKKKQNAVLKPKKKKREIVWLIYKDFDYVVKGGQFNNKNDVPREVYIEELEQYDVLTLEIETDNEFDTDAILVKCKNSDIGYVPKQHSKELKEYLQSDDFKTETYVKKIYKKNKNVSCIAVSEIRKKGFRDEH